MVPFHTPTVVSIKDTWFVSFSTHALAKSLTHSGHEIWRDRDRCYEIENGTIPYSNCSKNIKDTWFVSISTHVPTKNAKSLTHM